MIKISIHVIILFALISVHFHDVIPHEHEHEMHIHSETVFENLNYLFVDCNHSHEHPHFEHSFLYFLAKKNEIKSSKNLIKELNVIVLSDNKELKPEHLQIVENSSFSKELNEFTSIQLLRAPPSLIS